MVVYISLSIDLHELDMGKDGVSQRPQGINSADIRQFQEKKVYGSI